MYVAGHTLVECGARFGIEKTRVVQILVSMGIPRRPRGCPKGFRYPPHRLLDEVVALREQGETLEAIGRRFGFSRQAAHQILKRARPR